MLANFFEKTKPINSIVVGLVFCLFYVLNLFLSESLVFTVGNLMLGCVFLLVNFFFLFLSGRVVIGNSITNDNLLMPLFMVLLYALFPKTLGYNETIYVLLLFVLLYRRFSSLCKKQNVIGKLFDSGLLIGLMVLLFNWTILYLILVYVAMFLFQELSLRKLCIPLVGLFVPIVFYYTYTLSLGETDSFFALFDFNVKGSNAHFYDANKIQVITLSLFVLLSVVMMLPRMLSVSTLKKQQYTVTLFSLFIGGVLLYLSPAENETKVLYVFIPVAIILGQFVELISKKWIKDFILILCMILSLVILFTS